MAVLLGRMENRPTSRLFACTHHKHRKEAQMPRPRHYFGPRRATNKKISKLGGFFFGLINHIMRYRFSSLTSDFQSQKSLLRF